VINAENKAKLRTRMLEEVNGVGICLTRTVDADKYAAAIDEIKALRVKLLAYESYKEDGCIQMDDHGKFKCMVCPRKDAELRSLTEDLDEQAEAISKLEHQNKDLQRQLDDATALARANDDAVRSYREQRLPLLNEVLDIVEAWETGRVTSTRKTATEVIKAFIQDKALNSALGDVARGNPAAREFAARIRRVRPRGAVR